MSQSNLTRGHGLLEGFLARQRSKMADRLIPFTQRKGRILDIGCDTYALFLLSTEFSVKYGLNQVVQEDYGPQFQNQKIALLNYDIEKEGILSFEIEYFDVVTLLASFGHIELKN